MKKYWAIFKLQLANGLAYPGEFIGRSLLILPFLWLFFQFWRFTFDPSGGADINGHTSERVTQPASTVPGRHCLGQVEKGDPCLILAYRPFPEAQPYAEQGPIFLHADACERGGGGSRSGP